MLAILFILFPIILPVTTIAQFKAITETAVLTLAAADTACSESGWSTEDGAVVLQVVRNRARLAAKDWKRYDGTLLNALFSPAQHAHGCRAPITLAHIKLGVQFVTDTLPVEPWARHAIWYCNLEPEGTCENRCKGGCPYLSKVRHRYYGLASRNSRNNNPMTTASIETNRGLPPPRGLPVSRFMGGTD
jgi:hypothetical protein